jgi:hypothetical protein
LNELCTLVYLAKDDNPWEAGFGVIWDDGMVEKDSCHSDSAFVRECPEGLGKDYTHFAIAISLGGHIVMEFFNQHTEVWVVTCASRKVARRRGVLRNVLQMNRHQDDKRVSEVIRVWEKLQNTVDSARGPLRIIHVAHTR